MYKPVIAINNGGPVEIIKNNETGFLVNNSSSKVASKIIYFLEKPNQIKEFGLKGFKLCKKKFDIEINIGKISEVYEDLF